MSKKKEVIERINSIQSTKKITQAMKMVSASKLAKIQDKASMMQYYLNKLNDILFNLNNEKNIDLKFFHKNNFEDINKTLYIIISSDKGLCGSFNSKLINEVGLIFENNKSKNQQFFFITIGKKITSYFKKKYPSFFNDHFIDLNNSLSLELIEKLSEEITKQFLDKIYSEIKIIFNKPKNASESKVQIEKFLPIDIFSKNINNNFNNSNNDNFDLEATNDIEYLYEPDQNMLLQDTIPKVLKLKIYSALLHSSTSEHSARMLSMAKATDNAEELLKELKLSFNRSRQATITKELTEIVGGAEALRGAH